MTAAILCPDKKDLFENVYLSRRTVTQRVEDFAENMEQQLKDKVKYFTYFPMALDENSDACDTVQLLIFLRGITPDIEITEELASVQSMKSTTAGKYLLEEVNMFFFFFFFFLFTII